MASKLPQPAVAALAKRDHGLHHYVWHGVRNTWNRLSAGARQQILSLYPGW